MSAGEAEPVRPGPVREFQSADCDGDTHSSLDTRAPRSGDVCGRRRRTPTTSSVRAQTALEQSEHTRAVWLLWVAPTLAGLTGLG